MNVMDAVNMEHQVVITLPTWVASEMSQNRFFSDQLVGASTQVPQSRAVGTVGTMTSSKPAPPMGHEDYEVVSRIQAYHRFNNEFRISIVKQLSTKKHFVTYDGTFYEEGWGHDYRGQSVRAQVSRQQFIVLGEHDSATAAKARCKFLVDKYVKPEVEKENTKKRLTIKDTPGELCKTTLGRSTWSKGGWTTTSPEAIHIGDYVVSHNSHHKGWIFIVEQEDSARHSPLRIRPVFCGMEQIDFATRRVCVHGSEIDSVDMIALGRAFQNLKTVIEGIVKTKAGIF